MAKFAVAVMVLMVTAVLPLLDTVTVFGALVVVGAWLPKASVDGETVTEALVKLPALMNTFESS
jgi:hypothetical protein